MFVDRGTLLFIDSGALFLGSGLALIPVLSLALLFLSSLALLTVDSRASLFIDCGAVLVLLAVVVDGLRNPLGSAYRLDRYLILRKGRSIPQKETNLNKKLTVKAWFKTHFCKRLQLF